MFITFIQDVSNVSSQRADINVTIYTHTTYIHIHDAHYSMNIGDKILSRYSAIILDFPLEISSS